MITIDYSEATALVIGALLIIVYITLLWVRSHLDRR